MAETLEFRSGSTTGNDFVYAAPRDWVRSKTGFGISAAYDHQGHPKQLEVHADLGQDVSEVFEPFRQRLNELF